MPTSTPGTTTNPFPACYDPSLLNANSVANHRCTWTYFALKLQRQLDADEPIRSPLVLASHNSHNAALNGTISGQDPNQTLTMTDQLTLGMRGLELDIHWIQRIGLPPVFAPLLCHGTSSHQGCFGNEPHMDEGVAEIRAWLDDPDNADAFLHLDIQAEFDGQRVAFDTAAASLENAFGDLVFRPDPGLASGSCEPMPLHLSETDMMASGARLLITSSCGGGNAWNKIVFDTSLRSQKVHDGPVTYPDCDSANFSASDCLDRSQRYWEDTTRVGATADTAGLAITASVLDALHRCGTNQPSFDHITAGDTRLPAMVWSWAVSEPARSTTANCALHDADGRFIAADCTLNRRYACQSPGSREWHITAASGAAANGEAQCAQEFPGSRWSVPVSGYFNQQLREAKAAAGVAGEQLWLDYNDNGGDGLWVADP